MALSQVTGHRLLVRPESYRPRPDRNAAYVRYYLWAEAAKSGSPLWRTCQA
jgi:hypothetical protein